MYIRSIIINDFVILPLIYCPLQYIQKYSTCAVAELEEVGPYSML